MIHPLQAESVAKKFLVEELMALSGRTALDPLRRRRWLDSLSLAELHGLRDMTLADIDQRFGLSKVLD